LFVLFEKASQLQQLEQEVLTFISKAESEGRLPVHLSPLLASLDALESLGDELIHTISSETKSLRKMLLFCSYPPSSQPGFGGGLPAKSWSLSPARWGGLEGRSPSKKLFYFASHPLPLGLNLPGRAEKKQVKN